MLPTAPDRRVSAMIRVRGSEDAALYRCVQRISVTEDMDRGATFEVRIGLCRNEDGSWPRVDDPNLRHWNRITLIAAFPDHRDVILDGYITFVDLATDAGQDSLTLTITGVDALYLLSMEEKCRVWRDKTYEQIARQIIDAYKLKPELPAAGTDDPPPEGLPAVIQRGPDFRFLRELARRKGYELYARGGAIHFHPPDLTVKPQKTIASHFGEETNCRDLRITSDGTFPTRAIMSRIDPLTGKPEREAAESAGLPLLGTTSLADLHGAGIPPSTMAIRRQAAASRQQMKELVIGALRRHAWWVKATGTLNGLRYGRILRSKQLVTIKGLGKTNNGVYYVRKVDHDLGPRSYLMRFEASRNALGQLGSEDWKAERPDAAGSPLPVALAGSPEVVTVRESGPLVAPA